MRHRLAGRHLGRDTSHRLALYRNLVTDLLRYERITTTEAKAKEIRPMAEKIITLARRGDLHARRQAAAFLYDTKVVKNLFDSIGPRMASRPGGYLRITGLEPRKGDGAKMASIELVDFVDAPPTPRPQRVTASPGAAASRAAVAAPAALPIADSESEVADEVVAAEEAGTEAEVMLEGVATGDAPDAIVAEPEALAPVAEDEAEVAEQVVAADPATVDAESIAEAASEATAEAGKAEGDAKP
jgi:large subunit ribosomal protein L17